ncbi:Mycobacterium numidiamassiliense ORFan, partial [Mycobacterium numidiamassiliense]
VIFAGAAAIATLALFSAAPNGTGDNTVASGSVRLVDQATDSPPPPPGGPPPGVLLAPGMTWPPGTPLQQAPSMVLPGGLPLPPLPQGMALSPELQQEISQMYMQGQQMLAAGPPPNVPNEVCRYNTVRVPCPPA